MRIALPIQGDALARHFGHAARFAIYSTDAAGRTITEVSELDPPPHEPGVLPAWLGEVGAEVILAGGMGQRARVLFEEQGIRVVTGVAATNAREAVEAFLAGSLEAGENPCDH